MVGSSLAGTRLFASFCNRDYSSRAVSHHNNHFAISGRSSYITYAMSAALQLLLPDRLQRGYAGVKVSLGIGFGKL